MKMPQDVYDSLFTDIKAVIAKVEEIQLGGETLDPSRLTMRSMWDYYQIVVTDRSSADHPRHHMAKEGFLPRCVEFNDRSPYWLGDDHDLNDSHIETAFRKMIGELKVEYEAKASAPTP